jgi:hypothetical protein
LVAKIVSVEPVAPADYAENDGVRVTKTLACSFGEAVTPYTPRYP